jgi:HlyD family secretion protein
MKRIFEFRMLTVILCTLVSVFIFSCNRNNQEADAYGNFEADEVIVSAQSQGLLLFLDAVEGSLLTKDQTIGKIDTAVPLLKKEQLMAQHRVINARLLNLDAQLKVQDEQRVNLVREVNRTGKLYKENAATQQQYDDLIGKLNLLDMQTEALRSQKGIILGEQSVVNAQLDEALNMLEKCSVTSPLTGTVLEKYVEAGELVTPGKALIKVANIGEMELKVFVSGDQLPEIAMGDSVRIFIDSKDEDKKTLTGSVSWISTQVEFTPKIIQTREERVNMVYAVKIRVRNDGRLKIGMPGEVVFSK